MNMAEEVAIAWDYRELVLYVEPTNLAAVALYGTLGFKNADGLPPNGEAAPPPQAFGSWLLRLSRGSQTLCLRKAL